MGSASDIRRASMLGISVDLVSLEQLNGIVAAGVGGARKLVIGHHNLHSLSLCRRDATMRAFYEAADCVHIDGLPLVWLARLFGYPASTINRVTYIDWLGPLAALAEREKWRVFWLGGRPEVLAAGMGEIQRRHPTLSVAAHNGYFDLEPGSEQNRAVLRAIADAGTDLLFVGLGMPTQERWIRENLESIEARVILCCGGLIDYLASVVPTPPRWSGALGLEWLFRLGAEPRRLWRRYLLEPLALMPFVVRELARHRRQPRVEGASGKAPPTR